MKDAIFSVRYSNSKRRQNEHYSSLTASFHRNSHLSTNSCHATSHYDYRFNDGGNRTDLRHYQRYQNQVLAGRARIAFAGRGAALVFEKQSLRTRVSFEAGMMQLGGGSMFLGADVGFGTRESVPDFARTLSQYVDGIVIRANKHPMVVELAQHSTCPVINGLTDYSHPCQALADLYTLRELIGRLNGLTLAWVGDANNVCRSLVEACGLLGMRIVVASPPKVQLLQGGSRADQERYSADRFDDDRRSGGGDEGGRGRVHRRVGQHGAGSGDREAEGDLAAIK